MREVGRSGTTAFRHREILNHHQLMTFRHQKMPIQNQMMAFGHQATRFRRR